MSADIQVMLFIGFGYLMTFPRTFGYSALVQTMTVVSVTVEYALFWQGCIRMAAEGSQSFKLSWNRWATHIISR